MTHPDLELFKQQSLWFLNNLDTTPEVTLRPTSDHIPCIRLYDRLGRPGSHLAPNSVEFDLDGTTYAYAKHWGRWRKLRSHV